jgi:hypothetical protein
MPNLNAKLMGRSILTVTQGPARDAYRRAVRAMMAAGEREGLRMLSTLRYEV